MCVGVGTVCEVCGKCHKKFFKKLGEVLFKTHDFVSYREHFFVQKFKIIYTIEKLNYFQDKSVQMINNNNNCFLKKHILNQIQFLSTQNNKRAFYFIFDG